MAKATLIVMALVLAGCEVGETRRVQPERGRTGLRDVEASQRDVDRTLLEYRRQQERARRDALLDSDT